MKLRKILIIWMVPFAVNVFIGCCDCLQTVFLDYTNCEVSVHNLDNTGSMPIISANDSVPKEAYGLSINVTRKEDFCLKMNTPLFMSSAYALSCDCPATELFEPLDSLLSVKVISVEKFDSSHLENSDITEFFSVLLFTEFVPVDVFVATLPMELSRHEIEMGRLQFDLMLLTPPESPGEYHFEVEIRLSDGRTLRTNTSVNLI